MVANMHRNIKHKCNVTFGWQSRMGISFIIIIIMQGNDAFDIRLYTLCVFFLIVFLLIVIISFLFRSFIISLDLHLSVLLIFVKHLSLFFSTFCVRVIIWFISLIGLLELFLITGELIHFFFVTGFCLFICL